MNKYVVRFITIFFFWAVATVLLWRLTWALKGSVNVTHFLLGTIVLYGPFVAVILREIIYDLLAKVPIRFLNRLGYTVFFLTGEGTYKPVHEVERRLGQISISLGIVGSLLSLLGF